MIEDLHYFFITRSYAEIALILLVLLLPLVFFVISAINRYRDHKILQKQRGAIKEVLSRAQLQNESFEIHFDHQAGRTAYNALLHDISFEQIQFTILNRLPKTLIGQRADIFFCVIEQKRRLFYKFRVTVTDLKINKYGLSKISVSFPPSLELGQKRSFFRMTPLPNTVRVLALWLLAPEKNLPRTTAEIGPPFLSATLPKEEESKKEVKENFSLNVQDISGSGIGLKIKAQTDDPRLVKDAQILFLLVYNEAPKGEESLINFCCTGRITNIRQAAEGDPALILGIEFTNWALLEKGQRLIKWFHQPKATGIGPILQWVTKMDLEKRKQTKP